MKRGIRKKKKTQFLHPFSIGVFSFILISVCYTPVFIYGSSQSINTESKYNVYIYHDPRYPYAWFGSNASVTMLNYMEYIFTKFNINYSIINADELREITLNENPNRSILIFSQDVIPNTVWDGSATSSLIEWLHNGATIIWNGGWEFWYIGYQNGTLKHKVGMENVPFGKPVTVIENANVSITQRGIQNIPSLKSFQTRRPFSEDLLQGFYYEMYGFVQKDGTNIIDPGLIRVGEGFFVKIGATAGYQLDALERSIYITEFVLNRFFDYNIDLTTGLTYFNTDESGIVYILPHDVSTTYWNSTYGDRIYFYAYSNVTHYQESILTDFSIISKQYQFIILILPLEDTELFYYNLHQINTWATEKDLQILPVFFSKGKYEPEDFYLKRGSAAYNLTIHNMKFLLHQSSTLKIGIWYGWENRQVNLSEIENFYQSLPKQLKTKYCMWIDEPFIQNVIEAGLTELTNRLKLTVITELYSPKNLAVYGFHFDNQIVVTGYWNALTSEEWSIHMKKKLNYVFKPHILLHSRRLGVWIFWDENDASSERYQAYINDTLKNPLSMNIPPISSFSHLPNEVTIFDSVTFYDTSYDPDGKLISRFWNWGDNSTIDDVNSTHTYSDTGSYTVQLTVIDNDGYSHSTSRSIHVKNLPPIVDFAINPINPKKGEIVEFIDNSVDPEGKALTHSWDFGDGNTSTQHNPNHIFEKEGTYVVQYSVRDEEGKIEMTKKTIEIFSTMHNLTIELRDLLEIPMSNMEVHLYSNANELYTSGSTDVNGKITFIQVPEGEWHIKVSSFGYSTSKTTTVSTSQMIRVGVFFSKYTIVFSCVMITLLLIIMMIVRKKQVGLQ
jgi:PKD repeat protein